MGIRWGTAVVAVALGFGGLVGCTTGTGGVGAEPRQSTSADSRSATPSTSATPSALPSGMPSTDPTRSTGPAAPSTAITTPGAAAATPQAPGPTAPPQPQTPRSLPDQQADPSAFQACSDEYLDRAARVTVGAGITPVIIEQWATDYQRAGELAAEGEYAAAAKACGAVLDSMRTAMR